MRTILPLSTVRGFDYSGSWGTSGLDLWLRHDHGRMAIEVARGKKYFPGWNLARWWLSHEAFQRSPEAFAANFEAGLAVFAAHDILVMPVLFNRWRDPICDFGGVSIDHFTPGLCGFVTPEEFDDASDDSAPATSVSGIFRAYLEAVVGWFKDDARILAWDLCNEPFMGDYVDDQTSSVRAAELTWLTWTRDVVRVIGASQPVTIGNYPGMSAMRLTEPLSDFISFHPYFVPTPPPTGQAMPNGTPEGFEALLDEAVAFAQAAGKEILASETAWGANDDHVRAEILRYTLGELHKRSIGFVAHGLHHSLVADLHAAEYGPVGWPARLEFINADGTLRAGHDVYNEF
jgi:hypothetical protein